jgi:hypothetical protein
MKAVIQIFLFLPLLVVTLGQAEPEAAGKDMVREEQMQFLKQRAADLALCKAGDSKAVFALGPPLLRYSNWAGLSSDGATFLWLANARPVAAVSLSIRRPNNAVYRECSSLWASELDCRQGPTSVWSPKRGGLLAQPLNDAPPPAEGEAQRLAQMRQIARRFDVTWHHSRTDEKTQLRMLTAPIYRFAAEEEGILDGGLFAFVITNDPEMLLLVEAVRKPGEAGRWRYSFARMSSLKEVVRLDDREIWSVANYHQDPTDDRKTGPYSEQKVSTYTPAADGSGSKPQ